MVYVSPGCFAHLVPQAFWLGGGRKCSSSCVTALVFIINLTARHGRALPACAPGLRVGKDTQHEAQGVHVCVDWIQRQQNSCVHVLPIHSAQRIPACMRVRILTPLPTLSPSPTLSPTDPEPRAY